MDQTIDDPAVLQEIEAHMRANNALPADGEADEANQPVDGNPMDILLSSSFVCTLI